MAVLSINIMKPPDIKKKLNIIYIIIIILNLSALIAMIVLAIKFGIVSY